MKVVLSWLREFCPTDLAADELAEMLTSRGVKVEGILRPWERLSGVIVARVLDVRDHPGSDRLCLARVDTGAGEREVVVGVRNMSAGDLVPLAGPGATVPGLPQPLEAREIRGVVSDGMLCSPDELAISDDHSGILVLSGEVSLGADVGEALGLDDAVLDIEVEPNRPDLMSVVGVAREASAATGVPLRLPDTAVSEGPEKAVEAATVEILDLERCPRYLARVIRGVSAGPSPVAVQARLTAAGMRPLSNVVDATNYVLLEMGHPLHPFDLHLLDGDGIVVRTAAPGEHLVTLDGIERVLTEEDLVIADHSRGVAIAGVMGSSAAEVSEATRDVLLESAYFQPRGILRTARRLDLPTEASMRFERGADPEGVAPAAARAAALIVAWSGGEVLAGAADVGEPPPRRRLGIRRERTSLLLGFDVQAGEIVESLGRLEIEAREEDSAVTATIPGFRVDLEREVDLIEEVARVRGYERVGSTLPGVRQSGGAPPAYDFRRRLREGMVRAGLREIHSLSFASAADLELTGHPEAIRVANPLSAEEGYLRTSLIPGLLKALGRNVSRQARSAALFEVGSVFRVGDPVEERRFAAIAMTGPASAGWTERPREVDFFDGKGAVEAVLAGVGVAGWSLGDPPGRPFHPSRSAAVRAGAVAIGAVGEITPGIAASLDLGRVVAAEMDVGALMKHASREIVYRDVARFPPVHRDLAFVLDATIPADVVTSSLTAAGGDLVDTYLLFDVFTGPPVPEGKRSLAFSVDFRAADRTLTDDEVDAAVSRMSEHLAEEFGAELRAG